MTARALTLILPYYENPTQLQNQYRRIAGFPAEVRRALALIVVDDGSPKHPAAPPNGDLGIRHFELYRVLVDIRWNWLTCRNIAAHHAQTPWVLMTDIDHELPLDTARRIIDQPLDPEIVYRFNRVDAPHLTPYKPHPNTWLMTRAMFDKIGGYDERFSGYYGSDGEFRDRVRARSAGIVMLPEVMIRVPREVVPDASTTTYLRKQPEDHDGITRARQEIAKGAPPQRLSFPYSRVFPA